jgi:chaperonin GroES
MAKEMSEGERQKRALSCPLYPSKGKVTILPDEPPAQTQGGILLPEGARSQPAVGTVLRSACDDYKPFDRVAYTKYAGYVVEADDVDYLIVRADDVLCLVGEPTPIPRPDAEKSGKSGKPEKPKRQ